MDEARVIDVVGENRMHYGDTIVFGTRAPTVKARAKLWKNDGSDERVPSFYHGDGRTDVPKDQALKDMNATRGLKVLGPKGNEGTYSIDYALELGPGFRGTVRNVDHPPAGTRERYYYLSLSLTSRPKGQGITIDVDNDDVSRVMKSVKAGTITLTR